MDSFFSIPKPISHFHLIKPKSPSSLPKFFYISLYSTYSSSSASLPPSTSASRRHDEESKTVRVSVWWDIENCGVPTGTNVFKISNFITSAVRVNGIKGPVQVTAFGDVFCLSRAHQEALSSTGVNLVHIPQGGKNSADRSLLVDLMYWISQNPPPAHVFLISGDRDFAGILHKLRMINYNILLAGKEGKHTPSVLCSAASIMWNWNELAKGENLSGRHFNQPPDGPYHSWYGHYRGPLDDPYEVSEQNSTSEVENSSNTELSSKPNIRPVPLVVLRQLRRIVNAHSEGLTLNELQSAIIKSKVPIDKDFYGHKKFIRFLQSIPQIVNVESTFDGGYYLRPVPRKVQEHVEANDTKKANSQTPTITRMVEVEPKSPVAPYVNYRESAVENKAREETRVVSEDMASDVPQKGSSNQELLEKGSINADDVEISKASKAEKDSKSKIGFFRRLWYGEGADDMETNNASCGSTERATSKEEIKSTNQQGAQHPTDSSPTTINEDVKGNNIEKSKDRSGLITRVISWFKFWKSSSVKLPTIESSEELGSPEENSRKFDDCLHSKKRELFSKDSFWSALQSFLKTRKGSDIVLCSTSRDQIVESLQKEGPLVLRSFQKSDLHYLVDLLVSKKKWISEFPTKTPRFRIVYSHVGVSQELQPQDVQPTNPNLNGLSSIFKSSSSQENPQSRVLSTVHKKPSEKSRSEILADCQILLDDHLSQNPDGFKMSIFKRNFLEKYGYPLDHEKLGYPKLKSLLQIMPGVKLESDYVYSDKVVFSPGIDSLGIPDKSSGTGSSSPRKKEEGDSIWEELGPVAKSERDSSTPSQGNGNYEPLVSDDDEFSETEEDAASSSCRAKGEDRNGSRENEEDSALLQILNSWHGTSDTRYQAKGFEDSSKEDSESADSLGKQRPQKTYNFVADPVENKDKLINGILGSLKKSRGESKIQE